VDFHGRIVAQRNFTSDYAGDAANAADGHGHGTNVAGIVGARRDPAKNTDPVGEHEGVAPDAGLAALKVLSNSGRGSFAAVEDALQWVLDNARDPSSPAKTDEDKRKLPITVVNLSLSDQANHETAGAFATDRLRDLVKALAARHIPVVVAAGNEYFTHRSKQGMGYPAILPETLSVGAFYDANVGRQAYASLAVAEKTAPGQLTAFSQRLHESANPTSRTDLFAPGAVITSSGRANDRGESDQQGTSQAAPVTAGVILLMQQYHLRERGRLPTVDELAMWLRGGATDERDSYGDRDNVTNTDLTFRRLDAMSALSAMKRTLEGK
jgi:subtilisin family serine protease